MRISDWSSDVCSSDLNNRPATVGARPPRSTPASPVITATACCDTPSTKHSRHRPVRPIKEVPRDDEPDDENRGLPLAPAQGDERPRPPQHHRSGAPSGRSQRGDDLDAGLPDRHRRTRSEEHTSELQSLMRISYAVFCLTKKKNI